MKFNTRRKEVNAVTHEGGAGVKENAEKELTRGVSCLMLMEDTFYEKGADVAKRLADLCDKVSLKFLCDLAVKARGPLKLRSAPLWLIVQALRHKGTDAERNLVGQAISEVIQRADELAEIFAIYWKDGKKPVPRQLKAGVAKAFPKFNEYQLAKYNSDGKVKLRDALFLSHAKPTSEEMGILWKKLIDNKLAIPDTWETELSAGKDKKATFTRLLESGKLGYMALLRNLRNMSEVGVDTKLVSEAIKSGAVKSRALPFRFISAAKHAPSYAQVLSDAMETAVSNEEKLKGKTAIIVDTSGSMGVHLSGKSEVTYREAGGALAVLFRAVTPEARTFAFGTSPIEIKNYKGLGLIDEINCAEPKTGSGTDIPRAVDYVLRVFKDVERIVLITDMQSHMSGISMPSVAGRKAYYINVAPYEIAMPKFGGQWVEIDGWSERLVDWIREEERENG